jgi:hypothetical protein
MCINWYYCVYQLILSCVSIDTIGCINWYYCGHQLILLCVQIDTTVGINWYYCVYRLILLCVSIDTTVGINWYYCVYQLILLWVSIDTIPCINLYYCVYQLILSMLSDNMFQLFFFLKTSHTRFLHKTLLACCNIEKFRKKLAPMVVLRDRIAIVAAPAMNTAALIQNIFLSNIVTWIVIGSKFNVAIKNKLCNQRF